MKATSPARLVRWALRLAEYDFTIVYRKGEQNANADALSRLPLPEEIPNSHTNDSAELLNALITPRILTETIKQEQRRDPELTAIIQQLDSRTDDFK